MNIKTKILTVLLPGILLPIIALRAQETKTWVINAKKPVATIRPTMYGLFFEDINFSADGGLYAELIKNRSFEFPQALMGWNTFGNVEVRTGHPPFDRNPHYVRLGNPGHTHRQTGLENEGFRGIGLKEQASYRFSVWGKTVKPGTTGKIRVELIDNKNTIIEQKEIEIASGEWRKYTQSLLPKKTDANAKLRIFLASEDGVDLEHISLFPTDTWKERENGLRKDLAETLDNLNPGVFRFPGGCIVEGTDIESRYDWKKSVGKVENRPMNENRWNFCFPDRMFPDYFQSYGLGFYEYFLLAEDMGAEPLPIVNCGLTCQFQNDHPEAHVCLADLGSYIQDALDLVEFANGEVTTPWGKVRAEMGHPEPFNLKFIGIGNEQWGKEYPERLELFVKAFREEHPEIQLVGSAGPSSGDDKFHYLWPEMKRLKVDLVDEHYYQSPEWFLSNASLYDKYDRKGPKVFAGEYACHTREKNNDFEAALAEAAFMTGLERNADVVYMATYAPLFAHLEAWQWRPNLIWFDNHEVLLTPSYYVQQIYGNNPGTHVLTLTENKKPVAGQDGLYASATWDENKKEYIIKIANVNPVSQSLQLIMNGLPKDEEFSEVTCTRLTASGMEVQNTLSDPEAVKPLISKMDDWIGNSYPFSIESKTFVMVKVKSKK